MISAVWFPERGRDRSEESKVIGDRVGPGVLVDGVRVRLVESRMQSVSVEQEEENMERSKHEITIAL